MAVTDDQVAAAIAQLGAAGFYVNALGRTNAAGACAVLCISLSRLRNRHTGGTAPRSYRPGVTSGPRFYDVRELLEYVAERETERNSFPPATTDNRAQPRASGERRKRAGACSP